MRVCSVSQAVGKDLLEYLHTQGIMLEKTDNIETCRMFRYCKEQVFWMKQQLAMRPKGTPLTTVHGYKAIIAGAEYYLVFNITMIDLDSGLIGGCGQVLYAGTNIVQANQAYEILSKLK